MEIYLGFEWGTVQANSDSSSQKGLGQAVCRQLGYWTYALAGTVAQLG